MGRPGRVATTLFLRRARIVNRGVLAALNTVLRALKEVQAQLSTLRWVAEEHRQTTTAATAARKAADLSLTLYRDGASSYLDVVTAQSAALEAERLAIVLHTANWWPISALC